MMPGSLTCYLRLVSRLTPCAAARTALAIISPALRAKLSSYIGAGSLTDAWLGVSPAVPLGRSSENSFAFLTPGPLAGDIIEG